MLSGWNGYSFRMLEKPDIPKILAMLRTSFYVDEPMNKILGYTEDLANDKDRRIAQILNLKQCTFYAVPKDEPDEVAAVLIIWYLKQGFQLPACEFRSPSTGIVRKTLAALAAKYDVHEQRGISEYPDVALVATDRNHRGKGLATEMYRRAIDKVKSEGYPLVTSTFTNPFSRKIGEKLGFQTVARLDLDDMKHNDGTLMFGDAGHPHFIVETVLEL